MKISKNKDVINYINTLLLVKEDNMISAQIYVDYFNDFYRAYSEISPQNPNILLEKQFKETFLEDLDIDPNDEQLNYIISANKVDNFTLLDTSEYLSNPYYKNIAPKISKRGNITLTYETYPPFLGFVYDDLIVGDDYREITPVGFFKEEFKHLAILQDDTIWMSIIPHEINTMKTPINSAHGNVLVFGLGLGYYTYMISLKDEVNSIDVIEFDKKVIDVFNQEILPLIPNEYAKKISIKHADAYEYIKNVKENQYDYAFVDIYHNAFDGVICYYQIKPYEKHLSTTTFAYWIEDSLICLMRRQMLTLIEETINGSTEKDYLNERNINDRIINALYFLTKNVELNTTSDVKKFLSKDSLSAIAQKFDQVAIKL